MTDRRDRLDLVPSKGGTRDEIQNVPLTSSWDEWDEIGCGEPIMHQACEMHDAGTGVAGHDHA